MPLSSKLWLLLVPQNICWHDSLGLIVFEFVTGSHSLVSFDCISSCPWQTFCLFPIRRIFLCPVERNSLLNSVKSKYVETFNSIICVYLCMWQQQVLSMDRVPELLHTATDYLNGQSLNTWSSSLLHCRSLFFPPDLTEKTPWHFRTQGFYTKDWLPPVLCWRIAHTMFKNHYYCTKRGKTANISTTFPETI